MPGGHAHDAGGARMIRTRPDVATMVVTISTIEGPLGLGYVHCQGLQ